MNEKVETGVILDGQCRDAILATTEIVKQFQNGEYESLEDLVMNAHPDEIEDSDIFNKIPDVGQNFDAAMEY